jgi:hypothetical protein
LRIDIGKYAENDAGRSCEEQDRKAATFRNLFGWVDGKGARKSAWR